MMNDKQEELTRSLCRIGGPLVLFICAPFLTYALVRVTIDGIRQGHKLAINPDMFNFLFVAVAYVFGVWLCNRGYGWFGSQRK